MPPRGRGTQIRHDRCRQSCCGYYSAQPRDTTWRVEASIYWSHEQSFNSELRQSSHTSRIESHISSARHLLSNHTRANQRQKRAFRLSCGSRRPDVFREQTTPPPGQSLTCFERAHLVQWARICHKAGISVVDILPKLSHSSFGPSPGTVSR